MQTSGVVLTPAQGRRLSGQRKAVMQSREFSGREDLALRYSQSGLPYVSEHCVYLTLFLAEPRQLGLDRFRQLAADLDKSAREADFAWVATAATSFAQWRMWAAGNGLPLAEELFAGESELRQILEERQPPYALTGGDLFFQIQALEAETALKMKDWVVDRLSDVIDADRTSFTLGDSLHAGRVYGGRLLHGLIGSVDPVCFSVRAVIGDELPQHKGGCFCLT